MNSISRIICFSAVCLAAAAENASAALSVLPGDLLVGFYKVNPAGTGVEANTYIYNAGPASGFRENTATPITIDNLNADLTTAFGASWGSDSNVRWLVVGVVGPTDATTAGDPARTTYFSRPAGSVPIVLSSAQRGNVATNLKTLSSSMNGAAENGAVDGGAIVPSSAPGNLTSFLSPTQSTNFGVSFAPFVSTGSGSSLVLYRTLHSTSGADLTSAQGSGDAVVGTGQYIGEFQLSSTGSLAFVPEPSAAMLAAAAGFLLARRRRN